jgi:hypothetical protein
MQSKERKMKMKFIDFLNSCKPKFANVINIGISDNETGYGEFTLYANTAEYERIFAKEFQNREVDTVTAVGQNDFEVSLKSENESRT